MRHWLLGLALCLNCGVAQAMCAGTDVRPTLSATERQALDTAGETTPYGTGNHWVGRRNDQTIHVIGTMHLDDPRWTPVMRAVTPVVERADLLFVEMTDTDQLAMQRALSEQPERVFITDGPTLPELLSEDDWQRLSNVMAKRGVPKFMAAKMQPWMQTLMLGLPECALKTPELAQAGLDMRL
ncbi:MAG: TraB/GumN family protein, partial [Pseudomonadota bacterium]